VDNLIWKRENFGGISSSATNIEDASGLRRGHILELSGPPGCPKERVAVMAVKEVVREGSDVIFVGVFRALQVF
jgi:RAD51-like protein 2